MRNLIPHSSYYFIVAVAYWEVNVTIENTTTIDMEMTGMKLRRYANRYGYSVKDIQHYLGLSCPQPVYRWFKGAILPSVDNLLRLSELFNVHMEELLVKTNCLQSSKLCEGISLVRGDQLKRMRAYCSLLAS